MFRRDWIAVGGVALGLGAGCGPIYFTAVGLERARQKIEVAVAPNRLDYTVYEPSHRVALAASEVLKAELAESKILKVELARDHQFDTPEGKPPAPDTVVIPGDYPAFWFEGLPGSKDRIFANCRLVEFEGKTKDGRKVDATVRLEAVGSDRRTVVSVQVGGRGDASGSKALVDRIAERIKNPSTRPGSPEERAALKAAFDPGPKGKLDFAEATGEIKIRME